MEAIPPWIGDASAVTIVISLVAGLWWMLATGKLLPKSTHEMIVVGYERIITSQEKTIESQDKQISDLITGGETTKYVMKELVAAAEQRKVRSANGQQGD